MYTSIAALAFPVDPRERLQPNKSHPSEQRYRNDIAIRRPAARMKTRRCVRTIRYERACAWFIRCWPQPLPQSVFVLLLDRVISLNRPLFLASRSLPLTCGDRMDGERQKERKSDVAELRNRKARGEANGKINENQSKPPT